MMRNVLDWLEDAAWRAPEAVAFDCPGERLTWGQLMRRAQEIGSALASHIAPQSPVLILMEKRPACLAAMLGAVYAGCFYTPIDGAMPTVRMRTVASVLQPAVLLCDEKLLPAAQMLADFAPILCEAELPGTVDAPLLAARRAEQIDTDLLYVLFTSGSTGVPKGVAIAHRSVIDLIDWACEALALPEGCRFGSQAPFYFDNSVLDIYCAMKRAGSVYLIPRADFMFPVRLLARLQTERIDTVFWVPSALTALANAGVLTEDCLPALRRVFFCGEVMPCRTLNLWRRALPQADYVNMYGPTEITDVCAWYRVDRAFADDEALPIGHACANTRIWLIDGEICVSGTCLSAGYYNAPEKTAAAFVTDPQHPQTAARIYRTGDLGAYNKHGELMFLGRRDGQIKRSGYRIELGEIECALQAAESVKCGCCFYLAEREKIACAWTGEADEKTLKQALRSRLPKYMLPDIWLHLPALPQTGSGKIDRTALRRAYENEHPVA